MATRRYGQYCAIAKALDALGDRWALLIVRELLFGALRYSELQAALPGIPFLGSFTFGEQGCFPGGENRHGNLMISVLLFPRS